MKSIKQNPSYNLRLNKNMEIRIESTDLAKRNIEHERGNIIKPFLEEEPNELIYKTQKLK